MKYLTLIAALFLTVTGQSQLNLDTSYWKLDVIDVNDGLSAGYVYDIAVDASGYLWVATMQGLDRYDGYQFKHYTHDNLDSLSLPTNQVRAVHVDAKNQIWISLVGGTFIYIEKEDSFKKVSDEEFYHFREDAKGYLWGEKREHKLYILMLDELDKSLDVIDISIFFKGLPTTPLFSQIIHYKDNIWWAMNDTLYGYSLDYINKTAKLIIKLDIDRKGNLIENYSAIIEDKKRGLLWLFNDKTYHTIDPLTGSFHSTKAYPKELISSKGENTKVVKFIDDDGLIYFIPHGYGLVVYDPDNDQFSRILDRSFSKYDTQGNIIEIIQDRQHNIWMTTNGYGLKKFTSNRSIFKFYRDPLKGPGVSNLFFHPTKGIGYGSRISDKEGTFRFVDLERTSAITEFQFKIPTKAVNETNCTTLYGIHGDNWTLCEDRNQHLFYSTLDFTTESTNIARKLFKSSLYEDCSFYYEGDTVLWVSYYPKYSEGSQGSPFKVCRTDLRLRVESCFQFVHPSDEFRFGRVRQFYIDNYNRLWVGLTEGGILMIDGHSKEQQHFFNQKDGSGPSSNRIYSFLNDPTYPDSILWIGTEHGLNKWTYETCVFESFTTEEGLPNNLIYGILADDYDNLWLSTNFGLSRFNTKDNSIMSFTVEDGLQHNEFNTNTYLKDEDGILYFGGMGGLTYFDPNEFYKPSIPSFTVITSFKVDNKALAYTRKRKSEEQAGLHLDQPIEVTKALEVTYKDRMISFGFAYLDLSSPNKNQFRYKLEGFNDDWIDAGHSTEALYTNLPAGTFTFRVQGRNTNHQWDNEGPSIVLKVHGPWYKTWWFFLLASATVFLTIYKLFLNRLQEKIIIDKLRMRISNDLHDEIGSTLSSIALYGTVAQKKIEKKDPMYNLLSKINDSTTQVMESINDIVWAINSDNDKLVNVIQRMRTYLSSLSDATDIKITTDFQEQVFEISLNMVERRNLYLIFKESVNNAIKYSQALELKISLYEKDGWIHFNVVDNGIGFDQQLEDEKLSLGGNGLKNIKNRSEELSGKLDIISTKQAGTKIYFTFKIKK